MQHETGPLAIECHERCARFHILALHFERDRPGFSVALEEQQLMNSGYLLDICLGRDVLTVKQPFKVSKSFMKTNGIAMSLRTSSRCGYITVSSISAINGNAMMTFQIPSFPIPSFCLPRNFANVFKPSRRR
jgi:SAC3/GANP family